MSKDNYQPQEYDKEEDIPFQPDGNDPTLGSSGSAMRVRGTSKSFNGTEAVCKTIKIMQTDKVSLQNTKERMRQEASILNRTRHNHILKIITTYFYNSPNGVQFSIIMDHADGNLLEYLRPEKEPLPKWFGCLIGVLAYIHKQGIRHGDIKPNSILIKNKSVLLTNFDISHIDAWKAEQTTAPKWARWKTATYSAPEVGEGGIRGRSADIFSLGAVFLEMFLAHSDKDKFIELQSKLQFGNGKSYAYNVDTIGNWLAGMTTPPDGWKSVIFSLCQAMLDPEQDARPRAEELSSRWQSVSSDPSLRCLICEEASLSEDRDASSLQAIHRASAAGKVDVVRNLLGSGVNINAKDNGNETALYYAAGNGHDEVVKILLERGVALDESNDEGWTALHYAAERGQKTIVKLLLDGGANIDLTDAESWTPLHLAARNGHEQIVRLLLNKNANIDAVNKRGQTALHLAAKAGHENITTALLNKGIHIDAKDSQDQTALHFAAKGGHKGVVNILLSKGANVNAKNVKGQTTPYFAAMGGHKEVFKMLVGNEKADIMALF